MQKTSELWKELWNDGDTQRVYSVIINGVEYGDDQIVDISSQASLFDELSIGNATGAELHVEIAPSGDEQIPRGAKVERYVQLVNGQRMSEKLKKGEFFINKRQHDGYTWAFDCYDAMRKADNFWVPEKSETFPMKQTDAVARIAGIMGVEVDPRNLINPGYTIDYPDTNTTMRDILGWIAAANGGNFIISDDGKLRLVRFSDSTKILSALVDEGGALFGWGDRNTIIAFDDPAEEGGVDEKVVHKVGQDIVSGQSNGFYLPVSRVTLKADGQDFTAGLDYGVEIAGECLYAAQYVVDDLSQSIAGLEYRMFEATAVNIDLAYELGDGIEVDGVSSFIVTSRDDGSGFVDLSAPGSVEIAEEYPAAESTRSMRSTDRQLARTQAAIERSIDEVRLYVENEADGLRSQLTVMQDEIRQEITDTANNAESLIDQKLDSITLRVGSTQSDGTHSYADITLTIDGETERGRVNILGDASIDGNLVANALYSVKAFFNSLTAGKVNTQNNVSRYIDNNKEAYTYTAIDEDGIQLREYDTSGGRYKTQAKDENGNALYWEKSTAGATKKDGWYFDSQGNRIAMTTRNTGYPVYQFLGTDLQLLSINALEYDPNYPRVDIAINDNDSSVVFPGHLRHDSQAMNLFLDAGGGNYGIFIGFQNRYDMPQNTNGWQTKSSQVIIKGDPLVLQGLVQTTALDFSSWDDGVFSETLSDGTTKAYSVQFDQQGRPVSISEASKSKAATIGNNPSLKIKW